MSGNVHLWLVSDHALKDWLPACLPSEFYSLDPPPLPPTKPHIPRASHVALPVLSSCGAVWHEPLDFLVFAVATLHSTGLVGPHDVCMNHFQPIQSPLILLHCSDDR